MENKTIPSFYSFSSVEIGTDIICKNFTFHRLDLSFFPSLFFISKWGPREEGKMEKTTERYQIGIIDIILPQSNCTSNGCTKA